MKNGGYVIISHDDVNIFNKVDNAYNSGKPILFYDDDKTCYFIDSAKKVDDDYVLVKGGKTITITDSNTVSSTGSVTAPTMENIVDLAGNKRFVEINGILTERGLVLTDTYCKASLSGTHLMLVVSGVLPADADIDAYGLFATFTLPSYIYDKIHAVGGDFIELKSCTLMNTNNYGDTKTFNGFLRLWGDSVLAIGKLISEPTIVTSVDRAFRLQFDLLIDAE